MIVVPIYVNAFQISWLRIVAWFCVVFNIATVAECEYSLQQEKDFPIILKPFPTYSKAVGLSTTRPLTIGYIVISVFALGADLGLLVLLEKQPAKALRVFLYWNLFHFVVDIVIISYFFAVVTQKYDFNKAWSSTPMLTFAANIFRLFILVAVYQTYNAFTEQS